MAVSDYAGLAAPEAYTGGQAVNIGAADHTYGRSADALFVGGAGNVVFILTDGSGLTLTGVTAGSVIKLRHSGITRTNTTATNMAGLWK